MHLLMSHIFLKSLRVAVFNYLHRLDLFIYFLSFFQFQTEPQPPLTFFFVCLFFLFINHLLSDTRVFCPFFICWSFFLCYCPLQCFCASSKIRSTLKTQALFTSTFRFLGFYCFYLFIYFPKCLASPKAPVAMAMKRFSDLYDFTLAFPFDTKKAKKEEVLWELHGVRPPQALLLSSLKHNPRARRRRLHLLFPIFST